MNITRETDYAIRCIYALATHSSEILMIEEIAEEMLVPRSFLAKIVQKLRKAGLITSFRGVKGGFAMSRPPSKINLHDVIVAIQGPIVFNSCAHNSKPCDLQSTCSVHPVWSDLRHLVETRLKKWTFQKLVATPEAAVLSPRKGPGKTHPRKNPQASSVAAIVLPKKPEAKGKGKSKKAPTRTKKASPKIRRKK